MASSSSPPRFGLDLLRDFVRTVVAPEPSLQGEQVASVTVSLLVDIESKKSVTGTVSLYRRDAGEYRIGVALPFPLFGGLWSPVRRLSFTLDEVLDVVWTSSFRGGQLVLTPMARGGFRDLPTSPHGPVSFRVARKDRSEAKRLAETVALVDLPV